MTGASDVPAVSIIRLKDFYGVIIQITSVFSYDHNLHIVCIVTELPALSQSENLDVTWYNCSYLPFATAARLAHKQQLRSLNTSVWWKHKL